MSEARKCDVCGRLFIGYLDDTNQEYHRILIETQSLYLGHAISGATDTYDLCEKCATSLNEWLESQPGETC